MGGGKPLRNRDNYFDGLKFLMIFSVVLGHLYYYDYGLNINRMIYAFHMPVFVFLSGYFTSLNSSRQKQLKWIKETFLIYLFAQVCNTAVSYHLGAELTWKVLISPDFALWYLVCLIYWRIAVWMTKDLISIPKLTIISVLLSFLAGFVPIDTAFTFQRAFAFFPFFMLGLLFKRYSLVNLINRIPLWVSLIAFILGLYLSRLMPDFFMPKIHYVSLHAILYRFIQSSIAVLLCISIIRLSRIKFVSYFADLGQYTLIIYIGHIFFVRLRPIETYMENSFGIHLEILGAVIISTLYCMMFIMVAKFYRTLISTNRKLDYVE